MTYAFPANGYALTTSPVRCWVDFNLRNKEGSYKAPIKRVVGLIPQVGFWIEMADDEGVSMWGTVREIQEDWLIIDPLYDSWREA